MPRFLSKDGVWEAAPERVVNPDAPEGQEVYEGPDREALKVIAENGGSLGTHFSLDPELIQRAKMLGFKDVAEYLSVYGYDKVKAAKHFEEMKAQMLADCHKDPKRQAMLRTQSGGDNTAPGSEIPAKKGGFGVPPEAVISK